DDVVTDLDAVRHQMARSSAQGSMLEAFAAARRPLGYATFAILLALAPFLFLDTLATAFSRPLVLTYALTMLASMLVAFTLTPALAALLLRGDGTGREGSFGRQGQRFYDRKVAALLTRPRRAWARAGGRALAVPASVPQRRRAA